MENIVSATPAQWLSGYKPDVRMSKPAAPPSWVKKAEALNSPASSSQIEVDILKGLEKLSWAWNIDRQNKSIVDSLPVADYSSSWLNTSDNMVKGEENVVKNAEGISKEWLASWATEEEDDSQWLFRKENTPSSSPVHNLDKFSELFPCFQSKEMLGNWLLAHADNTNSALN